MLESSLKIIIKKKRKKKGINISMRENKNMIWFQLGRGTKIFQRWNAKQKRRDKREKIKRKKEKDEIKNNESKNTGEKKSNSCKMKN